MTYRMNSAETKIKAGNAVGKMSDGSWGAQFKLE